MVLSWHRYESICFFQSYYQSPVNFFIYIFIFMAYSKKELTGYERWYSDYIGKIVCEKNADSNDPYKSQWVPLIVYNNLGVEGYDLPWPLIKQTQSSSQTKPIHTKMQEPSEKSGGSFLLQRYKENRKLELQAACVSHQNVNRIWCHETLPCVDLSVTPSSANPNLA